MLVWLYMHVCDCVHAHVQACVVVCTHPLPCDGVHVHLCVCRTPWAHTPPPAPCRALGVELQHTSLTDPL